MVFWCRSPNWLRRYGSRNHLSRTQCHPCPDSWLPVLRNQLTSEQLSNNYFYCWCYDRCPPLHTPFACVHTAPAPPAGLHCIVVCVHELCMCVHIVLRPSSPSPCPLPLHTHMTAHRHFSAAMRKDREASLSVRMWCNAAFGIACRVAMESFEHGINGIVIRTQLPYICLLKKWFWFSACLFVCLGTLGEFRQSYTEKAYAHFCSHQNSWTLIFKEKYSEKLIYQKFKKF